MSENPTKDFFICHASEDKEEIARPLALYLTLLGFKVWYDEFSLHLGDSLIQSINRGLASSEFGVVIFSPHFFEKQWPQQELAGLYAKETRDGRPRILPIWHHVDVEFMTKQYPTLADRKAISSEESMGKIVRELIRASEGIIVLPENFPTPAQDVLLPDDIPVALGGIQEFAAKEFPPDEIWHLYQVSTLMGIRTVRQLNQLVTSRTIIDTLRTIFKEELLRPEDQLLDGFNFVLCGAFLLARGNTNESILWIKSEIQRSREYREKHPDSDIPARGHVMLDRIRTGRQLVGLVMDAKAIMPFNDDPANADQMNSMKEFVSDIEDLMNVSALLSPSDIIETAFTYNDAVLTMEQRGIYLFGRVVEQDIQFGNDTVNLPVLYILLSISNREPKIVIDS